MNTYERKKANRLQKVVDENTKLLKEAAELDGPKSELFVNLSHELRTPLNIILGTLRLLESYVRNNELQDSGGKFMTRMKIMRQNCYRLLRLVNNLIDSTKIDGGFFRVRMKNLNIVSIVEETTLSVADYIGDNNISLIFDTDCEEIIMACDPDSIERIILNLLSNAVKFTRQNGSIFVTVHQKDSSVVISVRDTGIGIPEDKTEAIFKRFQQVDDVLANSCQGSGIGLSLVKSLVELHGGKISVCSEIGKGSDFIIEMPVRLLPTDIQEPGTDTNKANSLNRIERINVEFSDIYMQDF
jgi:signal transduction histidine kinase